MDAEELRRVSKLLFGSKHRLEIAAAVATSPDHGIYGRAIAEQTGVADSQVWGELRRLEDAGLLTRVARTTREPQVRFRRRPSAYWDWIREVVGEVGQPAVALERHLLAGESHTFEACGSLFVPLNAWVRSGQDKASESGTVAHSVLRKIVAFLNADGGTLLIGAIEEARFASQEEALARLAAFPRIGGFAIVGMIDPSFLAHGWERWEARFRDLVETEIEPVPSPFMQIRREELAGVPVCQVTITPPQHAVPFFLRKGDDLVYYVRRDDLSTPLRGVPLMRHWQERVRAEEQAAVNE